MANITTRIVMEEEIRALEDTELDSITSDRVTNIKYFIVTDQSLIRLEMQAAFQSIYNKQDMLATSSNDLLNFHKRVNAKKTNPTHGELHGGTPNRGRT